MSLRRCFRRSVAIAGLAACAVSAWSGMAQAGLVTTTVTYSPYGLPPATGAVNSIDLTGDIGQTGFTVNPGADAVSVTAANGGAVVQGSSTNHYAAPVTGGTAANPTYWTAPYLSSNGSPGTVTLSFASRQSYFGLLWGSIGAGDVISFYDAGVLLSSVTGTQAQQAANGFNGVNGAQGFGGSQYTLINLAGGQFDTVVLGETGGPSFEAADFEYAAGNVVVPEPASLALLATCLIGGAIVFRRRKAVGAR